VGLLFREPRAKSLPRTLASLEELFSSSLFVAELLATLSRENRPLAEADPLLDVVALIHPERSLADECKQVLERGYLRGADLWHLATALFLAPSDRNQLLFISLDDQQRGQAKALGFGVWPRA
jgi:hypothetical protein